MKLHHSKLSTWQPTIVIFLLCLVSLQTNAKLLPLSHKERTFDFRRETREVTFEQIKSFVDGLKGERALETEVALPLEKGIVIAKEALEELGNYIEGQRSGTFYTRRFKWEPMLIKLTRGATIMWKAVLRGRQLLSGATRSRMLEEELKKMPASEENERLQKRIREYYTVDRDRLDKLIQENDAVRSDAHKVMIYLDTERNIQNSFDSFKRNIESEIHATPHFQIYHSSDRRNELYADMSF